MVINHLEKLFVTADAHTIINESDVHHPAAKMVAQAVKMQSNECGDNTNLILTMCGELMTQAAGLIQMGLHPSEILIGYDKASKKALELLETLDKKKLTFANEDGTVNVAELESALKPVIASKQYGNHDWLSAKVAEACVYTMPKNKIKFNVDNVRIQKILGGGINDSQVIRGVVVTKASETSVKRVVNAKVAVFNTNIEMQ